MSVQLDCQNFKRGTAFVAGARTTGRSVMERTKIKGGELCDCVIDNVILANSTLINVTGTTTDSFHNSVGVPSTSVGDSAEASAASSIAVGVDCLASGASSTAYGIRADVSGPRAVCIGTDANVTGADSIGISRGISVTGARSTAIGYQVDTALDDTVSYGQSLTPGTHSLALGHNISMSSDAQRNVAISAHNAALPQINSTSVDNVVIGHWSGTVVSSDQNVLIGYGNQLADNSVNGRVVIGNGNTCSFATSVALGSGCTSSGVAAVSIGTGCIANSQVSNLWINFFMSVMVLLLTFDMSVMVLLVMF